MRKNSFREAIDVLVWEKLKPLEMLRQIAKDRPATLVRAARALGYTTAVTLESRVKDILNADHGAGVSGLVEAIKLVRNEKSLGLKEAKDFVDALR